MTEPLTHDERQTVALGLLLVREYRATDHVEADFAVVNGMHKMAVKLGVCEELGWLLQHLPRVRIAPR